MISGESVCASAARLAAKHGRRKLLRWLVCATASINSVGERAACELAEIGDIEMLEFIRAKNPSCLQNIKKNLVGAALRGKQMGVLEWAEKVGLVEIYVHSYSSAKTMEALDWLQKHDEKCIFATAEAVKYVLYRMEAAGIEWVQRNPVGLGQLSQSPTDLKELLYSGINNENYALLDWLEGRTPIMELLTSRVAEMAMRNAAMCNRLSVFEWMHRRQAINRASLTRGVFYDIFLRCRHGILQWLHHHYPDITKSDVPWLCQCSSFLRWDGHLEMLQWVERTFSVADAWSAYGIARLAFLQQKRREPCYEHAYDRTPESVFVTAGAHEAWLRVRRRRCERTMLALLAAHRKLKRRSLPPELWELVVSLW